MEDYERDLLDNYRNPEPVPYTAEQLAEHIARGGNHHADYMWLLTRAEKADAENKELKEALIDLSDDFEREQKAHDEIAQICFEAGADTDDGSSISTVRNLAKMFTQTQQKADTLLARAEKAENELAHLTSDRDALDEENRMLSERIERLAEGVKNE